MLEEIRKEFETLVSLYEKEREARVRLSSKLEENRQENEALRKRIIDLERTVDNHTLAEAFTAVSEDHDAAKEKISKLIREMDRCISLLEK
ncbi:MAG: hypothetical protein ACI3ZH_03385 [Candidatus Cryptobacteroides sp.]|nr:hypothetical protein [Bacteroidales bacterium]MDD6053337.1 hypothetical protein [Bacteroidales bacterium]